MNKIKIAIVDDHKLIREMWKTMFSAKPEIEVVGSSGVFEEAIAMIRNTQPEIVLLDINLAEASGIDAIPLIRKYSPGTRIIGVSMHNQPAYTKKMLRLGAKGYVTKNSSHTEIFDAIENVLQGGTYICSEIKDLVSTQILKDSDNEPEIKSLSLREIEIVKLIKAGFISKEIAAQLNISLRTVEVHRHNILKKLKLKNVASLINFINTTDL